MIGYIYKVTDKDTGKFYIGKRQKKEFDVTYWGSSRELQIDILTKGEDKFKREIIDTAETVSELINKEIYHIKKTEAIRLGYNKTKGGEGILSNQDKVVKKVYSTKDYGKFKYLNQNREVTDTHVQRLVGEIKEVGQLNPIIVNSEMEVVDGQHRLEACKKIKCNLEYIVVDTTAMKAVLSINNVNKRWTLLDFIHKHASLGNEEYLYLKEHIEEYKGSMYQIPTKTLLKFLAGDVGTLSYGYPSKKVHNGEFKIHSIEGFELFGMYQAVVDRLKFDKPLPREISVPLFSLLSYKNFDLLRMLKKINESSRVKVFLDNWRNNDISSIFREYVALYNSGLSDESKNRIDYKTEELVESGEHKLVWKPTVENLSPRFFKKV